MIHVYGQGQPGDLGRPIFHHARGVEDVALRSRLPDRPSQGNGARTELDFRFRQASWGANLSTVVVLFARRCRRFFYYLL